MKSAIEQGDPQAANQLLPLVYDELRRLTSSSFSKRAHGSSLVWQNCVSSSRIAWACSRKVSTVTGRTGVHGFDCLFVEQTPYRFVAETVRICSMSFFSCASPEYSQKTGRFGRKT
jgi:ECF sigma factor